MRIYSTLSRRKEELKKSEKKLRLFVCGPTVYDSPHLGHARTYIFFDVFVRLLRIYGYKIFYLQNITDIDDKIIDKAKIENVTADTLSKKYSKEYLEAMKKLNITAVDAYAPATKYIREIIAQISVLLAKKHAYEIKGDGIYFDIKSFPSYGKLSKRTAESAEDSTSRIDESVNKKNKGDFALWKFSKPGEPKWKSPWGDGRPGWHIEDTAITEKYFGPQYDIHGGGLDIKFPHHEAEIAQQESASGKEPFVKLWMHTGFLLVQGKKMSKSLKNFITIQEFIEQFSPDVLRMLVLEHHYRSPIDYNATLAIQSQTNFHTITHFLALLKFVSKSKSQQDIGETDVQKVISEAERGFKDALNDDFNTPRAIASLFNLINNIQADKNTVFTLSAEDCNVLSGYISAKFKVMGFSMNLPKIPLKIRKIAEKRELYRKNKQFVPSDDLRKEINDLGYIIEDTPLGPFVWPTEQNLESRIQKSNAKSIKRQTKTTSTKFRS